jgi:hypothetical protein
MTGYFFMADLLGFGNIVRNSSDSELSARIGRWTSLVDSLAQEYGIANIQLISDTVFAATDSSAEGLTKLIRFSRELLNRGVPLSLPVRGAITHGEYEWGRLTYGKAVVAAHDLETAQNWLGVTCDGVLPHINGCWGFGSLLAYPAPMKSGPIMIRPVVDWDVPSANVLSGLLCREGLTRPHEIIHWGFAEKLNNTIQFSIYKAIVQKAKGNPEQFHGLSTMEAIELNVLHQLQTERPGTSVTN